MAKMLVYTAGVGHQGQSMLGNDMAQSKAQLDPSGWTAIRVDAADTVATALRPISAGVHPRIADSAAPVLVSPIERGHKFALTAIAKGEPVLKYGQPIGVALCDIAAGEHVHLHNLEGFAGRAERWERRA